MRNRSNKDIISKNQCMFFEKISIKLKVDRHGKAKQKPILSRIPLCPW